jgi:hypothetical protein
VAPGGIGVHHLHLASAGLDLSTACTIVATCFDEMRPQLIAHHGSGWAPQKLPERLRAAYSRSSGRSAPTTSTAGRLQGRLCTHENAGEVLAFHRQITMRHDSRLRIDLSADILSTCKTPKRQLVPRRSQ